MADSDQDSDQEWGASLDRDGDGDGDSSDLDHEDALEMEAVFGLNSKAQEEGDDGEEKKVFVYNKARLLEKLEEIRLGRAEGFEELPWDTLQVVTSSTSLQQKLEGKTEDDFTRESAIVQQGLEAAEEGYAQLRSLGIPYIRPDDYFAEMAKTDQHMDRVRKRLLAEKTRVEGIEERRRLKQMKKYGKEIQKEKKKQREQEKKATLDAVKQWRKDGKPSNVDDESYLKSFDKDDPKKGQKGQKGQKRGIGGASPLSGKKRKTKTELKNEKYGYGGPKKRAKKNTAESTHSMEGFSLKRNRAVPKDLVSKLPKKKQAQLSKKGSATKRPGKNRRRQSV